jgi:PAS domain S-box-containing protein
MTDARPPIEDQSALIAALKASEAKFSGILDIAADAIITINEQQQILHYNRGAEEIFGWRATEVLGKSLEILLPKRFRTGHAAHIKSFGAASEPSRRMGHRREVSGLHQGEVEFPAEASISKLELADGSRVFTVVLRDITERKRAEETERFLAEAGTKLAASLDVDAIQAAICAAAVPALADACLVDVVEAVAGPIRRTIAAVTPEVAATLRELNHRFPLTWDSASPIVDVLRRGQEQVIDRIDAEWLESNEDQPGAVDLWLGLSPTSMRILPLAGAGHTSGAISLIRLARGNRPILDEGVAGTKFAIRAGLALENAKLYSAARRATQARDDVLAVVSHDLRNPLSSIAICARTLREEANAGTEQATMLEAIAEATDWMSRLIHDLLDATAIEAGRLSIVRSTEALGPIIESAVHMAAGAAAPKHLRLSTVLPDDLPPVIADAGRVGQVIGNLLANAVRFTEPGGTIEVRARQQGSSVEVAVVDTGIGIPVEEQTRVFDRFWQARRTAGRGTGLGLSIARGIVEAHGGSIWLESEPGRGSTFTFTLPIDTATDA